MGEWGQSIKHIGKVGQTSKEQLKPMKTKTKQNITLTPASSRVEHAPADLYLIRAYKQAEAPERLLKTKQLMTFNSCALLYSRRLHV